MIRELRHYVRNDGLGEPLLVRFGDHVLPILADLGFRLSGLWTAADGSGELWYVLDWADDVEMAEAWRRFAADLRWISARTHSEADVGKLTRSLISRLVTVPDFARSTL
ncbi:NIPSNAP family protein [Rhizobium puerariae]|uniref:NIPSNAP family protein n=1 Tax=Rhizobium puerariae TaxID=1585791 RepID=A0ABV6AHA8_9HYPH